MSGKNKVYESDGKVRELGSEKLAVESAKMEIEYSIIIGNFNFEKTVFMEIITHDFEGKKIAEVLAENSVLNNTDDGLELLGNLYYSGFDKIIIHKKNISQDFFDLKTKIAGDILQKFAQYQMPLAIIGDFSNLESQSLDQFIFESNKGKQVNFLPTVADALKI